MSVVNATSNPKTQGALVAGIGALIGIVAFLLLPYFTFTITLTSSPPSSPQSHNASLTVGTGLISFLTGLIWLEALIAAAILVLAALLLQSKEAPFALSRASVDVQVRRAAYTLIILGIVGIAYHFLFISSIGPGQMYSTFLSLATDSNNVANQLSQEHISASSSLGNAIGSWIYLLGMAASAVGGVLMLRAVSPQAAAQPHSWPQYAQYSQPSQPQSQPWPQPSQPSQPGWPQPSQPLQPSQPGWPQAQTQQPQAWPQSSHPSQPGWQPTPTPQQGWQPTQQAPQGWQPPQS